MKKYLFLLAALLAAAAFPLSAQVAEEPGEECTSIVVGRLASADGSLMTSHTCDGWSHTWVSMEPAAVHPKGAVHKVYSGTRNTLSRNDSTGIKYLGEIPEARRTYSYLNTGYPCLNEKQLAIGETTFRGPDTLKSKNGIFLIEELARIALQRCEKARDAVLLMGSLAEKYGYIDVGECLTVIDKKEAWFFEITAAGKDQKGAVWVAKRLPDDEITISANIPRIGRIEKDKKNFLTSGNAEEVALRYGLWDGKGEFKYYKAYQGKNSGGKNFREREFWVLSHLAPSLGLTFDMEEIPFSVKPDKPVDVRDIAAFLRETYEGSEWDYCNNIRMGDKMSPCAHPWPTKPMQETVNTIAHGKFEYHRPVAMSWCAYSTLLQVRPWLPDNVGGICWLAVDNPAQSPRIPIFSGNTALPAAMDSCGHKKYIHDSFLWQFRRANKLATVGWQEVKDGHSKAISEMEEEAIRNLPGAKATAADLNSYTRKIYEMAASRWNELETAYWMKFGRGF